MLGIINYRQKKLLACLIDSGGYVSMNELMEAGGCSAKTVYRDMKQIQNLENVYGFTLTRRSRDGYGIEAGRDVKDRLRCELKQSRIVAAEESVDRRRYKIYLDLLMESPKPTTIQKLSDQYYVGKTSIVNDLNRVEEMAGRAGLTMDRTRGGTRIIGQESGIRNEIARLMSTIRLSDSKWEEAGSGRIDRDTCRMLNQIYGEREVRLVERAVEAMEMRMGRLLGDLYYINIITHLLITGQRIRSGQYIGEENVISRQEADSQVYLVIEGEMKKLGEFLSLSYPEIEILFLYTHFSSAGYGEMPGKEQMGSILSRLDENTVEFCRELVRGIHRNTCLLSLKDENMFHYLLLHVNSMMNRLRYNIRIICPLKEQIIREFSQTYLLIREELLRLKKKYFPDSYISEDEICYLCLYFQTFMEAEKDRLRILVVCSTGVGTSHFVKKRIEGTFPGLEVADVVSLKQLRAHSLTGIDFVVSTVGVGMDLPVPVVTVSILMDQRDAMVISEAIVQSTRKEKRKQMELETVLSPENVRLQLKGRTKEEVLQEMTELLFENGYITSREDFLKELYLREEEGITGIGDGIAIPHGKSEVVTRTAIAVGRNREGIQWETFDDKPVQVVILFAVRDVDRSQHIMLLSRVAELLCDKEVSKGLLKAEDTETILNILKGV